jgi:hypothetical protein
MKYTIDNKEYDVIIIKKNNKNTYLRVKEDMKIYITTSLFTNRLAIKHILDENQKTIKKMIESQIKKNKKNDFFNYLGNSYEVFIDDVDEVKILDDAIFTRNDKQLEQWLKNNIKTIFKNRLDYNYNRYKEKIPYPKLKIRNMKTRWGVCNIRDNSVTLNSKLIEYELDKLDYVIIHELSHFIHFNHSKEFWKQVEKYTPDYKKIRKDLKD